MIITLSFVDKIQYKNKRVEFANEDINYLYLLSNDLNNYVMTEINELRLEYTDVFFKPQIIFK